MIGLFKTDIPKLVVFFQKISVIIMRNEFHNTPLKHRTCAARASLSPDSTFVSLCKDGQRQKVMQNVFLIRL